MYSPAFSSGQVYMCGVLFFWVLLFSSIYVLYVPHNSRLLPKATVVSWRFSCIAHPGWLTARRHRSEKLARKVEIAENQIPLGILTSSLRPPRFQCGHLRIIFLAKKGWKQRAPPRCRTWPGIRQILCRMKWALDCSVVKVTSSSIVTKVNVKKTIFSAHYLSKTSSTLCTGKEILFFPDMIHMRKQSLKILTNLSPSIIIF